jgi:nucleoside-diphosphate-sugar epimerase
MDLIVNNSQFQGAPADPMFGDLQGAPSFRNLQHRLADRIFDWAQVHAVHIQAPPYYENVRALVSRSVAERDAAFLPWGDGDAVIPLVGAQDVARVAATLLTHSSAPSANRYPLVSETQTVRQIVATLSKAIGRPIRYVPITDQQWIDRAKERINLHALDHLSHLWQYFREGKEPRQNTDTIREVTGRDAQTLEEFFRANLESFAPAGR